MAPKIEIRSQILSHIFRFKEVLPFMIESPQGCGAEALHITPHNSLSW